MSAWTRGEYQSFQATTTGQITLESPEGMELYSRLKDLSQAGTIQTVVEIGTWNGLGSTKCILEAVQGTSTQVWSLECNGEKMDAAKQNLQSLVSPTVHLVYGTIVNPEEVMSNPDVLEPFEDEINQEWLLADMKNCAMAPNVLSELPSTIDFLVLDGGEYTTLYEFTLLFPRCTSFIALDDTFTCKTKRVREILLAHPHWKEIYTSEGRNGFSLFQRAE
jgi:hypothetical protein